MPKLKLHIHHQQSEPDRQTCAAHGHHMSTETEKEKLKRSFFTANMILSVENPNKSTKKKATNTNK